MIKWRVTIRVMFYEVDWVFDTAEEAVEFAVMAAKGTTENGGPITVTINGIMPEKEGEENE